MRTARAIEEIRAALGALRAAYGDGSGPNAGFTFASPLVGGNGTVAQEVYWRDANANGVINGDEARGFGTGRANFVLRLEGNIIPEPASLSLMGVAGLALLRRRRGA